MNEAVIRHESDKESHQDMVDKHYELIETVETMLHLFPSKPTMEGLSLDEQLDKPCRASKLLEGEQRVDDMNNQKFLDQAKCFICDQLAFIGSKECKQCETLFCQQCVALVN